MKYVVFLRGVNVGGKGIISMRELKEALQNAGFESVLTLINSGNVVFKSVEPSSEQLEKEIESLLKEKFFAIDTVVLSYKELETVLKKAPKNWTNEDIRKYIAFVKRPATPEDVIKEIELTEGVDFIDKGPGVVYMTTKLEGLMKSGFRKLITKKVYKSLTMRNVTTVKKLFSLMD